MCRVMATQDVADDDSQEGVDPPRHGALHARTGPARRASRCRCGTATAQFLDPAALRPAELVEVDRDRHVGPSGHDLRSAITLWAGPVGQAGEWAVFGQPTCVG